jgi:hypothetical protein
LQQKWKKIEMLSKYEQVNLRKIDIWEGLGMDLEEIGINTR